MGDNYERGYEQGYEQGYERGLLHGTLYTCGSIAAGLGALMVVWYIILPLA